MTDNLDAIKATIVDLKGSHFPIETSQGAIGYTSLSEPEKKLCDVLVAIVDVLEVNARHNHGVGVIYTTTPFDSLA